MNAAIVTPQWPAPPNVHALVTTRQLPGNSQPPFDACNLGVRCGEDKDRVRANRVALARSFGLPAMPHWLHQVHAADVVEFDAAAADPDAGEIDAEPRADAVLTRRPGEVLAVLTADCLPILICADDGSEIAAIHAGWRGLAAGVIEACVGRLRTPRQQQLVWLGPAIGPQSYEVGADVRAAMLAHDVQAAAAFVPTRPGHWLCDLYTLARQRLHALGMTQIFGTAFDTFSDARFYSHRRDRVTGRFVSLIWRSG